MIYHTYPQWFKDILQFHVHAEQIVGTTPEIPDDATIALRERLIKEEVGETLSAISEGNLVEIADGIADSIVVLLGTAIAYGIDMDTVWNEVHRSNMMKFKDGVKKDAGGKVIKPEGWTAPDISTLLERQQSLKDVYAQAACKYTYIEPHE